MKTDEKRENPFPYTDGNKRYHTLSYHMQKMFGTRVEKAAINGGFTCPNIDGTVSFGGCSFCLNGSGEFAPSATYSVSKQLEMENIRIQKKYEHSKLIAYFQSNTNTYAPCDRLRKVFGEALQHPNVVGLCIGTRPDCIDKENLELLAELSKQTYLTVELGLQTVHDKTALRFNRGYTIADFQRSFESLKEKGIRVGVHLINGLYNETRDEMIETARVVGKIRPDSVKIHLLHILKGTRIEQEFEHGDFTPITRDGYIDTVCRQLAVLPPECVIERLTGDGPKDKLICPKWSMDKISILAAIDRELYLRSSYQGELF